MNDYDKLKAFLCVALAAALGACGGGGGGDAPPPPAPPPPPPPSAYTIGGTVSARGIE